MAVHLRERTGGSRRKNPAVRGYHRILVPVSDLGPSEEAIALACRLAAERRTSVAALTVVEVPMELPLEAHMFGEDAHAKRVLSDAQAIGDLYGVAIHAGVIHARDAGVAIVAHACEWKVEMVVLHAPRKEHRRSSLFGHTVDYVLRHAPCRVMVAAAPVAP